MSGLTDAQEVKVITSVSPANDGIVVKWYGKHIITKSGVNIYRKEEGSGDWIKINNALISKKKTLPASLLTKDSTILALKTFLEQAPYEKYDGFVLLILMVKSVQYPELSDFLGIRYVDKTAVKGKTYRYKISDTNGKDLGMSEPITFSSYKRMKAPQNFLLKVKKYRPSLTWSPDEQTFMGYFVYRTNDVSKPPQLLTHEPVIATKNSKGKYPDYFFYDDSLKPGQVFYYRITGIDYFGNESEPTTYLKAVIKDVTPPKAPVSFKGKASGKIVNLFWSAKKDDADFAGFNIYRSVSKDTGFKKVNKTLIDKGQLLYMDTVNNAGLYYYKVSSVDTAGNEAFSYVIPVKVFDVFPPASPSGVTVMADTGKMIIRWRKNQEKDLAGYFIYRTINTGMSKQSFLLLNKEPVKDTIYTDILPKEAKNKFFYKVVAVDTAGNRSEMSSFAAAVMPDVVPPDQPVIKQVTPKDNAAVIEWLPNTDRDLKGYNIYRLEQKDTVFVTKKLNTKIIKKDITRYTDIFVKAGNKYSYYLVAIDTSGNTSVKSEKVSVVIPGGGTKGKITGVKIKYSKAKKTAKISWQVKSSDKIKGFAVFRKSADNEPLKPVTGLITTNEYSDKKLKEGKEYYYQIRAYTVSGNVIKSKLEKLTVKPKK